MKGKREPPLDQLSGLIEVANDIAAELPASSSEAQREMIDALAVARISVCRMAAEHKATRKMKARL